VESKRRLQLQLVEWMGPLAKEPVRLFLPVRELSWLGRQLWKLSIQYSVRAMRHVSLWQGVLMRTVVGVAEVVAAVAEEEAPEARNVAFV